MQKVATVNDFNKIYSVFQKFTDDIHFKFNDRGLHVRNMTTNGFMMINLQNKIDVLSHYEFYVGMQSLEKINGDDVDVYYDENYVRFDRGKIKLKIKPVDERNIKPLKDPKINWEYETVPLGKEDVDDIKKVLNKEAVFFVELWDGNFTVTTGDQLEGTSWTKEGIVDQKLKMKTKLSVDLVMEGLNGYKHFDEFEMCIGNETPLIFRAKSETMDYELLVAPRIDND